MSTKNLKVSLSGVFLLSFIAFAGGACASDDGNEKVLPYPQIQSPVKTLEQPPVLEEEFSDWDLVNNSEVDEKDLDKVASKVNMIRETGKFLTSTLSIIKLFQQTQAAVGGVDLERLQAQVAGLNPDEVNEVADATADAVEGAAKEFSAGSRALGKAIARAKYYVLPYLPAMPSFLQSSPVGLEKPENSEEKKDDPVSILLDMDDKLRD